MMLNIKDLYAKVEEKDILKGLSIEVKPGEVHAIMGPNGSGKSTMGNVLSGRPGYEATAGSVTFKGQDLLEMETEERAREGLFLAFQYPVEIPGVSNMEFLKAAVDAKRKHQGLEEMSSVDFLKLARETCKRVNLDASFLKRGLNEGFSGGEKKRNEIMQMTALAPHCGVEIRGVQLAEATGDAALLDEIRTAVWEHGVALLRDQDFGPQEHIAFARAWGGIDINNYFPLTDAHPEIAVGRKAAGQETNIGGAWHTDHSYDQVPAMGSILVARTLPPKGGDTLFAHMGAAYDALPDTLKQEIEGLEAYHTADHIYEEGGLYAQTDMGRFVAYTSVAHFGFIALGVFAFSSQAFAGATLYMVLVGRRNRPEQEPPPEEQVREERIRRKREEDDDPDPEEEDEEDA